MARQQSDITKGITLNYDDVTGAYRITISNRLPYRVEVTVEDSDGVVDKFTDVGDVIADADNRILQFKRKNQSRSGAIVPIIRITSRWPA